MTNKIEIGKKYRTRHGKTARVICTDAKDKEYPVIVLVTELDGTEHTKCCSETGQYYENTEHDYDLIEVSPWDDFKVDEPVMVRDYDSDKWARRYFAGVLGGQPRTWAGGATSWSNSTQLNTVLWPQCRRPTEQELQEKTTP